MATCIRYSKKREAILSAIQNTKDHPSAEWLFQKLKPEYPDLSLGTIYRNLSFFQDQGQIKSVGVVKGQERFDADTSDHSHFICEHCGRVVDLESNPNVQDCPDGFVIERVELCLYGTCNHCCKQQILS
ncbi:MAG: transcriptional repressor [Eubacteriales bacterium]